MTECAPVISVRSVGRVIQGSVGFTPAGTEVKVLNDKGQEVRTGEFLDEFVKTYYIEFPKTKVAILTSSIDPKDEERATEYTIAIDFL